MAANPVPTYTQKPGERNRVGRRLNKPFGSAAPSLASQLSSSIRRGKPSQSRGITLIRPAPVKQTQLNSRAQRAPCFFQRS